MSRSNQRGSNSTFKFKTEAMISAVSFVRSNGLAISKSNFTPSFFQRPARAPTCARPVSLSGKSACPCQRDSALPTDSPWRNKVMWKGCGLISIFVLLPLYQINWAAFNFLKYISHINTDETKQDHNDAACDQGDRHQRTPACNDTFCLPC